MSRYFENHGEDVVTQFSRRGTATLSAGQARRVAQGEGTITGLAFLLPDGRTVLRANTQREIMIGRRARTEDPAVTIDLHPYDGHQMGVSRCHAMIVLIDNKVYLRDLNSVNGTAINNAPLRALDRKELQSGDRISFGNMLVQIHFIMD